MLSIPLDIQYKAVHDPSPKSKYNAFMHRMKKYNIKQTSNFTNTQNQSSNFAKTLHPKNKSSIQKFLALGDKQQGQLEKNLNPTTSENLRKTTLSPRSRKSYTYYTKKQNNQLQHMPEISQTPKNKANISIILSTSYKRPLWRSLQMNNAKKTFNTTVGKCNIFKKSRQQDSISQNPQIQFYNTSNIFIFKKLKEKMFQFKGFTEKKKQTSANSNNIKFKNNQLKEQVLYGNSARLSSQRMRYFFSHAMQKSLQPPVRIQQKIRKNLEKIQDPVIKPVKIKQHKQDLSVVGLQNKFIQGVCGLQPWNFAAQDQGHHFIRQSPLNNG